MIIHRNSFSPAQLILSRMLFLVAIAALKPTAALALSWDIDGPSGDNINDEPIFKIMTARGLTERRSSS